MVTPLVAVSATLGIVGGAALMALLLTLRQEARQLAGRQSTLLLAATILVGAWVFLRALEAFVPLGSGEGYFFFRNGLLLAGSAVALRAVMSFPGVTSSHRTGALIVAGSGALAVVLSPFPYGTIGFTSGLGCLAAIVAILAWRLEGRATPPGVRALAYAGTAIAIADAWLDPLFLRAGLAGDFRLFRVSTITTSCVILLVALFAFPALREGAPAPAPPPPPAAEATGP